jgi:hypothetical protein
LTNNLKSFKLTREAPKTTLMFCKFEHMCYLNVQAPITTKNAYWLFVTTKRTWILFIFQFVGSTIWERNDCWSRSWRDTLPCYSSQGRSSYEYLKF